ncbi:XK-related protein 8-like [Tachysurus fulvidraco]|uniref:XK-related protein 8-like n=1 Tax=Tachysurus fulvidraco TaxID=1234273 RepID=UPI000F4DEDEC|nr:XK-related protein 8-like [Tachysurus fulvidraco]
MEVEGSFCLAFSGVVSSFLSLIFFLLDVVLDLWAVECLYEKEKYFSIGLLIFFLLGSSVLMQIFSWIWYSDPDKTAPETKVESFIRRHNLLGLVHIFQLGVLLRIAAVIEISICRFKRRDLCPTTNLIHIKHNLKMLLLFEAFSENVPQLVLLTPFIVEMQEIQVFTVLKITSLSYTVLSYHRKMREFLADKHKMGWSSSVFYFLWNSFLIGPRVVSVTLFASELPCYIAAHFLSLWTLLVLWAWWQKTDFMDSKAGEWLYRATVGIIWYFSWFKVMVKKNKVAPGSTKHKAVIYHVVMGMDTMLLLALWWWKRSVESARLCPLPIDPNLLITLLVTIYIIGVLLKLVYYWKFHPKHADLHINKNDLKLQMKSEGDAEHHDVVETDSREIPDPEP